MFKPDVCIYHANCADGFGAAWAVWKRFPDIEFVAATYGEVPQKRHFLGKNLLLVDFSYKQPMMREIAAQAGAVMVLDHHKTAQAELEPLFAEGIITGRFDMEKSGAVLAWEEFHQAEPLPGLLFHIQDRDLWKFEDMDTKAIHAWLMSSPFTFNGFSVAVERIEGTLTADQATHAGLAILRKQDQDIAATLKASRRRMTIGGYYVPVANVPFMWASDAGHILGQDEPFAATYQDTAEGRMFSLRSSKVGLDVSEVAKRYGGGGHAHAAGFIMEHGWEGDKGDAAPSQAAT